MQEQVIDIAKRILGKEVAKSTVMRWCIKGLGTAGVLAATRKQVGSRVYWLSDEATVRDYLQRRKSGVRPDCVPCVVPQDHEPPADVPCEFPAGSEGKIEALTMRMEHGYPLWNPLDNPMLKCEVSRASCPQGEPEFDEDDDE